MENYQMFFPCSSSPSMPVSAYPVSSSNSITMNSQPNHFITNHQTNHSIKINDEDNDIDLDHHAMNMNNKEGKSSSSGGDKIIKKGEKKIKKPKYAFQTRSQVDILDDGYRWRKYGQKAVKDNKFPRSYYRCTHQGCNVKKQVQRLTKDEAVVVTTYEGIHTHPIEKHSDNFEHILNQMQIYNNPI